MKRRQLVWSLSSCLAALALSVCADVALKNAVIVHPDVMTGWESNAVADLRTALAQISGREYTAVAESGRPADGVKVYVGNTRAAAEAGIDVKKLEPQQFRIKAAGDAVYIAGGSPTGTSYGVSTFLQDNFGVYQLDWDCILYPKNPSPAVREQDKTQKPDIMVRDIYNNFFRSETPPEVKRAWAEYYRRNRLSWARADRNTPGCRESYQVPLCHSFFAYVPPKKYFKTHPEYYSMDKEGVRRISPSGQVCPTNRDVRRITLESLIGFIKKDRAENPSAPPTLYDLSQEDNTSFLCLCPECRKFLARHGNKDSALNLDYVNEIASKIRKLYPEVQLRTFAYVSTEEPADGLRIEDNVWVRYCDVYSRSNHMYPLTDPVNRQRLELFRKWMSICKKVELWDYILDVGGTPLTAVDSIIGDTRLFVKHGLQKIFVESEYHFCTSYKPATFHILQYFLQSQLLFDSSQDAEKLIDIFMTGYYGAAAPEMKAYLTLLRQAQKKDKTISMELWHTRALAHVKKDFLEQARTLILQGMEKVKNDKPLYVRAARELINVDCSLLRLGRGKPDPADRFKELQQEYTSVVTLHLKTFPLRENDRTALLKKLADDNAAADIKFTDLPEEIAKLPASKYVLAPYVYQTWYLHGKQVRDPDSSQPFSVRWISPRAEYKFPVTVGVYGRNSKQSSSRAIYSVEDEKYHWYKIGEFTLDPSSLIYAQDWCIGMELKDFYTLADGTAINPNKYDVWVSMKMQGPAYVKGSTRENGVFMDRAVLVKKY